MRKLIAIAIIVAAAFGAWRATHSDGGRGQEIFYGRAWIDHMPQTRSETFRVFGASNAFPFGWFAERTVWKGEWERFKYERRGDGQLEVVLPGSSRQLRLSYRAWKCSEQGFDYCLELAGSDGPRRYYSKRGWEKQDDLDAALTSVE